MEGGAIQRTISLKERLDPNYLKSSLNIDQFTSHKLKQNLILIRRPWLYADVMMSWHPRNFRMQW